MERAIGLFHHMIAAAIVALLAAFLCMPTPAFASSSQGAGDSADVAVFTQGLIGPAATEKLLGVVDHASGTVQKMQDEARKATVVDKALKKARKVSSSTDYFIAVDLDAKRTVVFKWDGKEWLLEKYWICSVGAPESPTVVGTYEVADRGESFSKDGYTCYYYTQFFGNYLFHSVKYDEGTKHVQDGRLGKAVSEGCVRLKIKNAKWIYDTIPSGTRVVTYE